ncbi:MAG TPA: thiolase family protein [Xanthobacteraceae bacterium]|nr:thiolase family protein [Xanthobacteraceae bacterium]
MTLATIAGVGITRFGKQADRTIEEIGREALIRAMKDAGVARDDIDEVFCGSSYGGPLIGQRILRDLGMTGIPITNVENACSSGAAALREACWAIKAGRADTIAVLGVEKLTRFGGGTLPLEPTDVEANLGNVMPAVYAMRARRYMHETGATARHLAMIAVKAHEYGARNPNAQFQNRITVDDVMRSRMVADPLTLYMCCPTGDGAAAVIVTSEKRARELGARPIQVAASVLQSGLYKTGFRDMASSELTQRTSQLAYEAAGIGPQDVSLAEVHDAFASAELMYYETLGLCAKGEGAAMIERGDSGPGGRQPVNPSGGLACRGHPVGATGVAQIVEAVWQLRGQAGERQVPNAKVALTHCTGGGISGLDHGACAVHVLTS